MNQESRKQERWNALSPTRCHGPEAIGLGIKPIHLLPVFLIDLYV